MEVTPNITTLDGVVCPVSAMGALAHIAHVYAVAAARERPVLRSRYVKTYMAAMCTEFPGADADHYMSWGAAHLRSMVTRLSDSSVATNHLEGWRGLLRHCLDSAAPSTLPARLLLCGSSNPRRDAAPLAKRDKLGLLVTAAVCLGPGLPVEAGLPHSLPPVDVKSSCSLYEQDGCQLIGPVSGTCYCLKQCTCNARNALSNRHANMPPPPGEAFAGPVFRSFMRMADSCAALYSPDEDGWIDSFTGAKRAKLKDGLMEVGGGIARVNLAIKREVSGYPTKGRGIQMVARVGTQCETGPHVSALQKAVKQVMREYQVSPGVTVTFACGMTPSELSEWGRGSGLTYFECDGKSWDATQGRNHQDFKFAFYDRVDPNLRARLTAADGPDGPGQYTKGQ